MTIYETAKAAVNVTRIAPTIPKHTLWCVTWRDTSVYPPGKDPMDMRLDEISKWAEWYRSDALGIIIARSTEPLTWVQAKSNMTTRGCYGMRVTAVPEALGVLTEVLLEGIVLVMAHWEAKMIEAQEEGLGWERPEPRESPIARFGILYGGDPCAQARAKPFERRPRAAAEDPEACPITAGKSARREEAGDNDGGDDHGPAAARGTRAERMVLTAVPPPAAGAPPRQPPTVVKREKVETQRVETPIPSSHVEVFDLCGGETQAQALFPADVMTSQEEEALAEELARGLARTEK